MKIPGLNVLDQCCKAFATILLFALLNFDVDNINITATYWCYVHIIHITLFLTEIVKMRGLFFLQTSKKPAFHLSILML